MTVLRKDPLLVGSLRYNRLTEKIDVTKVLWWNKEPCVLTNKGRKALRYFFEKYYGLFNESVMDDALDLEAYSKEYHPICEYLETLEWDGKERIRNVLKVYMGADDSDMVYEMLKHFMMGALNRIYCPGCKFDEMLCLVGQQGAGKSTFFRFLALDDQWFSDSLKNLNMEKPYELLRGHWILEMSEMTAAISAKSIEETKSFLSRMKETHRNPYEKYEEDRPRQCVFAGSSNNRQFIPFDRTGARRFLPIEIDSSKAEKHILDDEPEAREYFDQLWAEAMVLLNAAENKSELLRFDSEMEFNINEYRKQFMQEDTMAGMIQGWLDSYDGNYVCSIQLWKNPLTIMTESRRNLRQMKSVRSWILRLSGGREADIIALQRKDMGSRDAGFGEIQMVATTKEERDLLTFPKPNRWHFLLTSPTEKEDSF